MPLVEGHANPGLSHVSATFSEFLTALLRSTRKAVACRSSNPPGPRGAVQRQRSVGRFGEDWVMAGAIGGATAIIGLQ